MSEIETFFDSDHELTIKKAPYKVGGVENIWRNNNFFGSDHVLTLKKAPYKVGGQNDINRKSGITTLLIGWKQPFIVEEQKSWSNFGSDRVLTPEKAPYKVEGK